eukprot:721286-Hanusia_phi.AAC.2
MHFDTVIASTSVPSQESPSTDLIQFDISILADNNSSSSLPVLALLDTGASLSVASRSFRNSSYRPRNFLSRSSARR